MNTENRIDRLERMLDGPTGLDHRARIVIYDPQAGLPEREPDDQRPRVLIPDNGREPDTA